MNKKILLFLLFSLVSFAKETTYLTGIKDPVKEYNKWQDQMLNLELKQIERETKLLNGQGKKQDAELAIMYKDAEFYDYVATNKLKRDLIRAKIYYYYYGGYRRYYYFNYDWNVIYIN